MQAAPAVPQKQENDTVHNGQKEQSSSPAPKSKAKTDVQSSNSRGESPAKRIRIPCKNQAKCKNPSCSYWHLPVCHNHKSQSGCKHGKNANSDMMMLRRRQARSRRKGALKDQSQEALAPDQNSGTERSSRGIIHKCEPHERNPCAPRFEERSYEVTSRQESQYLFQNHRRSVCRFGSFHAYAEQKRLKPSRRWDDPGSHHASERERRSSNNPGSTSFCSRSWPVRDCAITRRSASSSIGW